MSHVHLRPSSLIPPQIGKLLNQSLLLSKHVLVQPRDNGKSVHLPQLIV
jgi:hypothetical protein